MHKDALDNFWWTFRKLPRMSQNHVRRLCRERLGATREDATDLFNDFSQFDENGERLVYRDDGEARPLSKLHLQDH